MKQISMVETILSMDDKPPQTGCSMCIIQYIQERTSHTRQSQGLGLCTLPNVILRTGVFFFFYIMFNIYIQHFGYDRPNSSSPSSCSLDQTCTIVPLYPLYPSLVFDPLCIPVCFISPTLLFSSIFGL